MVSSKGKRGGDPSRIPPLVTLTYACVICGKTGEVETRKPQHQPLPKTCSTSCASALVRESAKAVILQFLSRTPETGDIPQNIAEELMKAYNWLQNAEAGQVKNVRLSCKHCGAAFTAFISKNSKGSSEASKFCSFACRDSNASNLPEGVVCSAPRKAGHATEVEAVAVAEKMNSRLFLEGDEEGVQPYACSCGKWHTGHKSKRDWLDAAQETITLVNKKTFALTNA